MKPVKNISSEIIIKTTKTVHQKYLIHLGFFLLIIYFIVKNKGLFVNNPINLQIINKSTYLLLFTTVLHYCQAPASKIPRGIKIWQGHALPLVAHRLKGEPPSPIISKALGSGNKKILDFIVILRNKVIFIIKKITI